MKRLPHVVLLLVFIGFALSSCGNKGDLYIPKKDDTQQNDQQND